MPRHKALINLARAASLALAGVVVWSVRPGQWLAGSFLVLLVGLGALRACFEDVRPVPEVVRPVDTDRRSVTVLIRVGAEPDELVLSTAVLAEQLGPVILFASPDRPVTALEGLGHAVHRIEMGHPGLRDRVTTETALVLSPGALPDTDGVDVARGMVSGDVGWVTGASVPVSPPGWRGLNQLVTARQRARIRAAGGVLWEPNATLVRRDLIPDAAPPRSALLGDWLRNGSRRGLRGVNTATVLSRQLLLADGKHYWPREFQQHKGAAADLHRALRAGPGRARRAELVGLSHELSAWPLLAWLLVPLLVVASGGFPLTIPAWVFWTAAVVVGTLRWRAIRSELGQPAHLLDEMRSRLTEAPGSISAVVAATTGRLRPQRREAPSQPLLMIAAAISLATTVAFVGTRPSESAMVTPLAIGLLQLILLWRLGAQSIARGMWSRRTYRIRPAWDVRVDGEAASIVDASLSGLGVVSARDDIAVGAHPPVSVTFPDGTGVAGRGIVVRAQKRPVGTVLGLSLEVTPEQRTSWMVHLLQDRSLSEPEGVGQAADFETSRSWRARVERVGQAVVILAGTVVFLAVALLGLGYRPLTIVSPSMRPTLSIGDVVIEQRATISSVRVGDIVTVPSSVTGGSSLTHRVRSISLDGSSVRLETRGDANTTSELFIVPRDTMVGKVVLKVPVVGRVLRRLSSQPVQWFAYGLAALLVAIIGLRQLTGPTSAKPASARPASARPASASVDHGGKDESEDVAYRIDAAPPHSASTAVPVGVEDRGSAIQGAGGDGGLDDASPRPNPAWQTS